MKIDWTKIVQTFVIVLFGIWAVAELSRVLQLVVRPVVQPQETKIDYSGMDSTSLLIEKYIPIIDSLRNSRIQRKILRNEVPKKVALYSDSDVVRFNDSIMSRLGLK